ncbi:MAG: hypothetical protein JWM11_588 [Planctomycetaceae bacterium]|nr:hypothetical protein [Planctomycetaceae bacterium]
MNESVADNSSSNANSATAPPDWFLKRRARQDELSRKNGTQAVSLPGSTTAPSIITDGSSGLDSDDDALAEDNSDFAELNQVLKSELSEFEAILEQAAHAHIDPDTSSGDLDQAEVEADQAVPDQSAPDKTASRITSGQGDQAQPRRFAANGQPTAAASVRAALANPRAQVNPPQVNPRQPNQSQAAPPQVHPTRPASITKPAPIAPVVFDSPDKIDTFAPADSEKDSEIELDEPEYSQAETDTAFEFDLVVTPSPPREVRRASPSLLPLPAVIEFGAAPEVPAAEDFAGDAPDFSAAENLSAEDLSSENLSIVVQAKPVKIPVKVKPEREQALTPLQEFTQRWFGTDAVGSYAISVVLHLFVALLLSLMVFHKEIQEGALTTLLGRNPDDVETDLLDETIVTVDMAGGQSGEVKEMDLFKANSVASLSPLSASGLVDGLDANTSKGGEGDGHGNGIGDGLNVGGFQMPAAGKVVKKGSFTVWTVPHDPAPGQSYKIIIQVQYKKPGQKLLQTDITGLVRGTDKFERIISEKTTTIIPEANQVVLEIPGALDKVRDTISVHSTLLRESQRLMIEF